MRSHAKFNKYPKYIISFSRLTKCDCLEQYTYMWQIKLSLLATVVVDIDCVLVNLSRTDSRRLFNFVTEKCLAIHTHIFLFVI